LKLGQGCSPEVLDEIFSLIQRNSHDEVLRGFLFLQTHRKRFFAASGVEHAQHNHDQFRLRRTAFYSQLKSKVDNMKELGPADPQHALVKA
jgi:hypothetical protein